MRVSWPYAAACGALCANLAEANSFQSFKFSSLITFGDSYTDEGRLNYIQKHGQSPPVGWVAPVDNNTSSGGYQWSRLVSDYTGVNFYNYAVNGAVCSNKITPRWYAPINNNFPSLLEYEIPTYIKDSQYNTSSGPFLKGSQNETAYALWFGGNDLGVGGFLSDQQVPGTLIPDFVNCLFQAVDAIYANGARYIVLMNAAPMQLAPLFATPENGGVQSGDHYWPDKPSNITEVSYRMWETVTTTNDVLYYKVPYELLLANRYPGAHFALMDTYTILSDFHGNASSYLSAPVNATGFRRHCSHGCKNLPSDNNFFWWDELHFSQTIHEAFARNFVAVANGSSPYATYWG